jgi:PAS domain-containing protein
MDLFRRALEAHPLNGLALLLTAATVWWALGILRRPQHRHNRVLAALVGLVSLYQGVRLLQGAGIAPSWRGWEDSVDLLVTLVYLGSVMILQGSVREQRRTQMALRLAEAAEAAPAPSLTAPAAWHSTVPTGETIDDLSRAIVQQSPVAMFAVSLDGSVTYWNDAAERLLGWRRTEVLGHRLPTVVSHPVTAGDGLQLVRKTGELVPLTAQATPIRDGRGSVSGFLTVISRP